MANNQYVNKVVYNDSTLIDLTEDTITPESLLSGYTAHDRSGAFINGTAAIPTKVSDLENDVGYLVETDIVNNLTSSETQKPGSANMLRELKALLDGKIARITGSITSTGSVVDTTVDLPSGYTYTNSVIVGFGYATSASEYRHGNNAFGSNERVFARLTSQNKAQVTSNVNGTVYFEVIIAKIA